MKRLCFVVLENGQRLGPFLTDRSGDSSETRGAMITLRQLGLSGEVEFAISYDLGDKYGPQGKPVLAR